METVHILHTNDLHSHFENWPRIRRLMQTRRAQILAAGETPILVDLGDFSDRVHPLTEATNGQANVHLMNQVQYDAATIGNNEGIGNSQAELNQLYATANFDVILGNLYDQKKHELPAWCKPTKIMETKEGTKIGLLALTAPFPLTYQPNGWDILAADQILPKLINELKGKVDVLVLLSHLGLQEETRIAERYPEIAVIIGSHTHHLLPEGKKVNHSLLAAAGKFGRYVGEITLTFADNTLINREATVIPIEELAEIPQDKQEIDHYEMKGHQLLQEQEIAELPMALTVSTSSETPFIREGLRGIRRYAQTDAAILNSGLFLKDLPKGIINRDQLHQALPHPMHIIRITVNGTNLIRLVREIEKNRAFLRFFPMLGMGFRGKLFGEIFYEGIEYEEATKKVYYLGTEVVEEADYQVATVDHFMFVPFFPTIELYSKVDFLFPDFLRTVIGRSLEFYYPIAQKKDIIKNEKNPRW